MNTDISCALLILKACEFSDLSIADRETVHEFLRIVTQQLAQARKASQPLNLNDLRKKRGQPIWVEPISSDPCGPEDYWTKPWFPHWEVYGGSGITVHDRWNYGVVHRLSESEYEKTWIAYLKSTID